MPVNILSVPGLLVFRLLLSLNFLSFSIHSSILCHLSRSGISSPPVISFSSLHWGASRHFQASSDLPYSMPWICPWVSTQPEIPETPGKHPGSILVRCSVWKSSSSPLNPSEVTKGLFATCICKLIPLVTQRVIQQVHFTFFLLHNRPTLLFSNIVNVLLYKAS